MDATDEHLGALRRVPLFSGLSDDDLREIARDATECAFQPGQDIVTQGDPSGPFFLILDGRCRVLIDGKPRRTMGPGQYFGEMALLDEEPRSATVRAETEVRGLAVPCETFMEMLAGNFTIARKIMANLSRRLRGYDRDAGG